MNKILNTLSYPSKSGLAGFCLALGSVLMLAESKSFSQNTTLTYQGRVTSNGANFTGNGQFKFAIVSSTNNNHMATATATTSGGFVTILNPVALGNGYASAPAVTISGGGGSGATATANLTGGAVTSYTVNTPGSGYSSTPMVTVAPPPPNFSYTTFWSNDGTSNAGSEPATAIVAPVTNGLFLAALGDASVANMTTIPAALFVQPNLQLRIWFNDGINGSAVLSPLQNLTASPYAAYANTASNVLGAVTAGQISGALGSGNLSGSYGNTVIFNNGANSFNGAFNGNGGSLTNLQLANIGPAGTFVSASGFGLLNTYSVGNGPTDVQAVDLNADGQVDLVTANDSGSSLTVLTNNGNGVFGSNATLTVGLGPFSVAVADVNGDGKPDLISANNVGNSLSIYTNNGSGIFGSNATINVSGGPASVLVMDVNNDGRPDLISANYGGNTITILTNSSSGVFGSNATINVGSGPVGLVRLDVNNDGRQDIVVGNFTGSSLLVLTNNGSGSFGSNALLSLVYPAYRIATADFNGDGRPDLVAGNYATNTLTLFTNNGSGRFGFNATLTVGNNPLSVTAADVNGDGKPDLISANASDNSVTVLTNNGSGVFNLMGTYPVGVTPYAIAAADVTHDGKTDLICANNSDNSLAVLANIAQSVSVGNGMIVAGNFFGGGGGLTGLNGSQITSGTVADARLSGNVALRNSFNDFYGTNYFESAANSYNGYDYNGSVVHADIFNGNTVSATFSGNFSGDGSGIIGLNANNVASGSLADARLSSNVALLNNNKTFTGANIFNNAGNSFTGSGAGLAGLNAASLAAGTVPDARLSGNVALLNANQAFTGSVTHSNATTTFATGAGNFVVRNDAGVVPGLVATGGIVPGHVRFRNYIEIFQNDAATSPGGLDVRNTNGFATILLNGANGSINCSNVIANGVLLTSDRNAKENFTALDGQAILAKVAALPITQWNYKVNSGEIRHVGPMAQDFHDAFGLDGADDKHISVVDEGGVALAAIQGLNEKLEATVHEKDARINELEKRLNGLEQALQSLQLKK